ncbi:MAG TPA: NUDIX hydrolase [Jatrophihabitans sp.]|nr:NUDIX hydrolase [Jatrophihabitans sp.]
MSEEFRVATPRVAAGVLFVDEADRVLLVKPTYKDGWDIPGGYVEPGESPKQAAAREVKEELGLTHPIGRLLVVDWAPHPAEGDKLLFIFDGGKLGEDVGNLVIEKEEIDRVEFVDLAAAAERMPARLIERLVSARASSTDAYLEHGTRLTGA